MVPWPAVATIESGAEYENDPLSHTNQHEVFVRNNSCYFVDRSIYTSRQDRLKRWNQVITRMA